MAYTVQLGSSTVTIKADTILFEDGFVKFFCPGSKNLVAAYPTSLVAGIRKTEEPA